MEQATHSLLSGWESFYVIVGSSAAALTGLQFVVIALVAEARTRSTSREIAAFGTPTVVHFCSALLVSAILSAPWSALSGTGLALGASGLAGIMYAAIVVQRAVAIAVKRAKTQEGYRPVLEDWLWHAVLPFLAYAGLFAAALALRSHAASALFVAAAATLLLLFIGIHNAWDTVIYIAIDRPLAQERPKKR
jgi:hypothetical protein